jgi:hypothetical protein
MANRKKIEVLAFAIYRHVSNKLEGYKINQNRSHLSHSRYINIYDSESKKWYNIRISNHYIPNWKEFNKNYIVPLKKPVDLDRLVMKIKKYFRK